MVESNQNQDSNLGSRLQQDLKNDLIAGLLVVIPLATTIWLSSLVSKFVTNDDSQIVVAKGMTTNNPAIRSFFRSC